MTPEWLVDLTEWIYAQPLNRVLRETLWIIPSAQAVHIGAIGVVVASLLMVHLRVLGVIGRHQTVAATLKRFSPWIWGGAVVLLLSGAVMIYAEPDRPLLSATFQIKMLLVLIALGLTAIFQRGLKSDPEAWERRTQEFFGRGAAVASLSLLVAIVFAGRLTAYI